MRTSALQQQPFRASATAPRLRPTRVAARTVNVTCKAALTDVEQKALAAFKAGGKTTKVDTLRMLTRAGLGKQVDPEVVEGALLALEQIAAEEKSGPTPSIAGRWRLVFGTATKFRPFQYIPVREEFVINDETKALALESSIGPFDFYIRGVMAAWRPEEGALDFQFNKVDIHLNGEKKWEVSPKTKPKTYTFFHVGPDMACARSSAGGVALLIK